MKTCAPIAWLVGVTLLTAACNSGSSNPSAPPPPSPGGGGSVAEVSVGDDFYDPRQVEIQPGTTVRWILRGNQTNHTVTALNGTFDSGFVFTSSGARFEHTFTADDDGKTFEYSCDVHKDCCDMKGSIRVGASAPPPPPGY